MCGAEDTPKRSAGRGSALSDFAASTSDDLILATVPFGGSPILIAREGDAFEVAPGDLRTIADIDFIPSWLADAGHRHHVQDDAGRVVFRLSFADGSSGLFRATPAGIGAAVPLPPWLAAALALWLLGTGCCALRRGSLAEFV